MLPTGHIYDFVILKMCFAHIALMVWIKVHGSKSMSLRNHCLHLSIVGSNVSSKLKKKDGQMCAFGVGCQFIKQKVA